MKTQSGGWGDFRDASCKIPSSVSTRPVPRIFAWLSIQKAEGTAFIRRRVDASSSVASPLVAVASKFEASDGLTYQPPGAWNGFTPKALGSRGGGGGSGWHGAQLPQSAGWLHVHSLHHSWHTMVRRRRGGAASRTHTV